MTSKPKAALRIAGLLITVAALIFGVQLATAQTPGLYVVEGNPSCSTLYQSTVISGPASDLLDLGPLFGFKYDNNPTGSLSSSLTDHNPWVVTNGPQDPGNSVSIFNVVVDGGEGIQFDWSATLGIDAVIVKAQDANAYVYAPEVFGASGLMAPGGKAISHIEFCYDYEVDVSKDASTSFTRTYEWDIAKGPGAALIGFAGDSFSHEYTITVDRTGYTDSDWAVAGSIYVENNTPFDTTITGISDVVSPDIAADVDCPVTFPYTLVSGGALTCSYETALPDGSDRVNTATVATDPAGYVGGGQASADVLFGEPTSEVNTTVDVKDDYGTPALLEDDLLFEALVDGESVTYSRSLACSTDLQKYAGGSYSDPTLVNTAAIVQTGSSDTATVDLTCYIPTISKTVTGTYDERHEWDVEKTVLPGMQSAFAGETVFFNWTISVAESVFEENFDAYGTITVANPNPEDELVVSLVDYLNGAAAAIDQASCAFDGTYLTVAAGGSEVCDYTAYDLGYTALAEAPTANTATITLNGIDFSASAPIVWQANQIREAASLNDIQYPYQDEAVYDGWNVTYRDSYTCSTNLGDYSGGADLDNLVSNTAEIYADSALQDTSTAITEIDCYIPSISKTAGGAYDERHEWDVEKSVAPLSQAAFIGDTVYFDWTIEVAEEIFEENFDVSGTITVNNPNPEDELVVSLVDFVNGSPATISDCAFDGSYLTVAAGGSETCDYQVNGLPYSDVEAAPDTNTATITLNGIDFEAQDTIEWTANVIRGSASLDDDRFPYSGQEVYDGWTSTYQDSYTCSTNLAEYLGGADLDNQVSNTAEIYSGAALLDSSTATTEIDCYIPSIFKTAQGSYDERHEWDVEKTVDPDAQTGNPGDELGWTWTITVDEEIFEENFDVSGTITVTNPNPEDTLVVSLSDVLSDSTLAVIDPASCAFDGTHLTIAAGGSETCDYEVNDLPYSDVDAAPDTNTATATVNGVGFSDDASISYRVNVIRGSAVLSDDQIGLSGVTVSGGDQFTGSDSIICSTDRSVYGESGFYGSSVTNQALLTDSEANLYSDDAATSWLCEASFVDLRKTTNGAVDPSKDIRFDLYGFGGYFETVSTLGDADGILPFSTALAPGSSYTICESPVPAGYTFEISVDGGNVLTFAGPPGASNPTGEIQCFTFEAAVSPTTLLFNVNNRFPGGAPRTPGYWKNWSTCSGGNQANTAAALGGVAEGVFLLDNLLPQTLGDFTIGSCEVGVSILDSRSVDKGKNMANDGAYTLARALLAARLNQDAGACVPTMSWGELSSFEEVLTAADNLLEEVGFDGTGGYLGPKNKQDSDLRAYALYLYGIIDNYNNSAYCTGTPSH